MTTPPVFEVNRLHICAYDHLCAHYLRYAQPMGSSMDAIDHIRLFQAKDMVKRILLEKEPGGRNNKSAHNHCQVAIEPGNDRPTGRVDDGSTGRTGHESMCFQGSHAISQR
eukprot:6474338-Amphidinium_carterae.3